MKIVVWGLKGCGKTSFLKKLIHDTFEKVLYKRGFYSILFDSLKYSITFYEAPDSEEFFEQCIDISRESDGIIFAYDISKEFPIKYFNDIINCIENDKKKFNKHITYFILATKSDLISKDLAAFVDNNFIHFCNNKKMRIIGNISSSSDTKQKLEEIIENKLVKVIREKMEEKNKIKKVGLGGIFKIFNCYPLYKKDKEDSFQPLFFEYE